MSKVRAWVADKGDKMFVFEGKPQNLVDKSVLEQTSYIVLREFAATSGDTFDFAMRMAGVAGVPTDRFILAVSAIPLDPNDKNTGRFVDSSNKPTIPAITGAADWIASYYGNHASDWVYIMFNMISITRNRFINTLGRLFQQ